MLAGSLCIGLLVGVLLWILVSPPWSGLGVILALLLIGVGVLKRRKLSRLYAAWNDMARKVAQVAQVWVEGVCFYTVFLAVGRTGASLRLARPEPAANSLWTARKTLSPSAYIYRQRKTGDSFAQQSWTSGFVSWSAGSGNLWACCLLPFLLLLRALDTEADSEFPDDIYTLY